MKTPLATSDNAARVGRGSWSVSTGIGGAGLSNQVTTFTISDFGRTLTSNGRGSDHGWGGNAMVMGGAVQGGQLYGHFPEQVEDNPLDLNRGRFLPTTATDAMYAEVSRWMGVAPESLSRSYPIGPILRAAIRVRVSLAC